MHPSAHRILASLQASGLKRVPRGRAEPAASPGPAATSDPRTGTPSGSQVGKVQADMFALPGVEDPQAELAEIAAGVVACTQCKLHETRTKAVPGEGSPQARIVFVGEGPGADEDRTGRPFVGRAGKLLDDIIVKGMKMQREDVFICNVVKCRPPGNRVPQSDETAACSTWLERQIAAIAPKVICALGATAARWLLNDDRSMGRLRQEMHAWHGTPVVVTYHPAYLLRNPAAKAPCWEDIQKLMEVAGLR